MHTHLYFIPTKSVLQTWLQAVTAASEALIMSVPQKLKAGSQNLYLQQSALALQGTKAVNRTFPSPDLE